MLTWMRNIFSGAHSRELEQQRQRLWNARVEALEEVLGPNDGTVRRVSAEARRAGCADVLRFRQYVDGFTYATCDLIGNERQVPNKWGHYELMLCMHEENEWAPALLSRLAQYTHEATLQPGDTMDLAVLRPPDSNISGLLFARPDPPADAFSVLGVPANLVLCIGITSSEFADCKNFGSGVMLRMIREKEIFPYTVLNRDPVN
jgi:hypothetical protein